MRCTPRRLREARRDHPGAMATGARKKVVILGGGVAGMSAAHELVERGFVVEVFERKALAGGKARSISATGPSTGLSPFGPRPAKKAPVRPAGPPLPGEHGFRFFPGFYKHIVDTMGRIPYQGGTVAQNLVDTTELMMAPFDRPSYLLPAQFPRTSDDVKIDVFAVIALLSGQIGVPLDDGFFFAVKMWEFLTSCEERRLVEYERINWWDFIEAGSRSKAYQKYFGDGITRSLVAAKARRASTKTIGDIFMQIVFEILLPGVAADRVLNGPTNDVWINPWLKHLQQQGVSYHLNADVRAIQCDRGIVRSATVAVGSSLREVTGDYFIGALPVERMAELVSPGLLQLDPSLANLHALTEYVEWMNGIQFYLTEDVPIAKGHAIYVDSPWALTSVSQPQFWKAFDLAKYGDGTVKGLLSVDISDWDVKGLNGKEARHCSREEIALETWEQLKRSLNVGGEVLRDDQLHSWFLDPDIEDLDADGDPATPRFDTNAEPLLVNYVDTWRFRPEAVTRIPNFFLASDYVRTFTDLATMESANEAARRAVNGVILAARSDVPLCQIWNLHEPEVLLPFRAYDRVRYRKGLSWDGQAMAFARSVLGLATDAARYSGAGRGDGPARALQESLRQILGASPELVAMPPEEPGLAASDPDLPGQSGPPGHVEEVAAEARASSDEGLRRLRFVRSQQ
jgi:uncharacterized protein with NAD-binding domain and iron-sulfur cluster